MSGQYNTVHVKVNKTHSRIVLPRYESDGASGLDLKAFIENNITIPPLGREKVPTGLRIELPQGFEAQIRPRSGLAFKKGLTVLNSPGTIDSDYRGEIEVILVNLSPENIIIKDGDRIAQLVVSAVCRVSLEETDDLSVTGRGSGGFGSTGA